MELFDLDEDPISVMQYSTIQANVLVYPLAAYPHVVFFISFISIINWIG